MKRRMLVFLSTLAVVGGLLALSPESVRKARAATEIQQGNGLLLQVFAHPPARMCVGEKAWTQVAISGKVVGNLDVTAESKQGTLSQLNWHWEYGSAGVYVLGLMTRTEFTATEAGNAQIIFHVSGGGGGMISIGFETVDCSYEIQLSAVETVFADEIAYHLTIEGDGLIDAHDMIYGEGSYSFSLLVNYKIPEQGLSCTTTIPSTGTSSFEVQGSRTDAGLNISLIFTPVVLSGGKVKCVDANGRETDIPPVFQGEVNVAEAVDLTNVNIAPLQAYKFTFPTQGRGFLTLIPRRKS